MDYQWRLLILPGLMAGAGSKLELLSLCTTATILRLACPLHYVADSLKAKLLSRFFVSFKTKLFLSSIFSFRTALQQLHLSWHQTTSCGDELIK